MAANDDDHHDAMRNASARERDPAGDVVVAFWLVAPGWGSIEAAAMRAAVYRSAAA